MSQPAQAWLSLNRQLRLYNYADLLGQGTAVWVTCKRTQASYLVLPPVADPAPRADPACKSSGSGKGGAATADAAASPSATAAATSSSSSPTGTTATFRLGRKKIDMEQLGDSSFPEFFPGETVLHVVLPPKAQQAAASSRGAWLCISLKGTCDTLTELLGGAEPESAWRVSLLDTEKGW